MVEWSGEVGRGPKRDHSGEASFKGVPTTGATGLRKCEGYGTNYLILKSVAQPNPVMQPFDDPPEGIAYPF